MNRYVITGCAVVVFAGVVALVISLRSDNSQAKPNGKATASNTRPQVGSDVATDTGEQKRDERPTVDPPSHDTEGANHSGEYYRDDGAAVRDHRGGDKPPLDKGATARPRGLRKVDAETIVDVRNAVRPHVNRCADSVSDSALGDAPRIQGEVHLSIKDNHLTIDEVEVQLRDIDEGSHQALIECVKTATADIALDATGHPDVDDYTLTLPFDVKR